MKFIACGNKHCRNEELNNVITELENKGHEVLYTECMELCETPNKLFSTSDLSIYQDVSVDKVHEMIEGLADELKYISNKDEIVKYGEDPMHLRTIKLFRWHLDKQTKCTKEEVLVMMQEFSKKYDVKGLDFINPIMIALTKNIEGPDLPDLIYTLGKERVMGLLDDYLKSKINK